MTEAPLAFLRERSGATTSSGESDLRGAVEVSVVMPCLNEAETLEACIRKARGCLEQNNVRGEVVVADNGSTDGSVEIARRAGARLVHVAQRGYGAALIAGFTAASGQYLIMGDADDSYDFNGLMPFIERLRQGHDVVMGSRFKGGIAPGAMPWHHRYIGNPVLTGILNVFFRTGMSDAHCGLRGLSKDAFHRMDLRTPGMEFASEMLVKARSAGLKLAEVPTTLSPDGRSRAPHLRSFRDGWRHLRLLLLLAPNWTLIAPGALMMLAGAMLLLGIVRLPIPLPVPDARLAGSLLGVSIALLGSQLIALGAAAWLFSIGAELKRIPTWLAWVGRKASLERGLILSGVLACLGLSAVMMASTTLGASPGAAALLAGGLTLCALAVQCAAISFHLATLARPRRRFDARRSDDIHPWLTLGR